MKKNLLLAAMMAMGVSVTAQTMVAENFDSYTANDYVATQADDFTTWTNSPGTAEDAYVIDSVTAVSGTNCFVVTGPAGGGSTDLILDFGTQDKGNFEINLKIMVAEGKGGYFNLQKEASPGVEWGGDLFFDADSSGYFSHGGTDYPFSYVNGEWTGIRFLISLDLDEAWVLVNNELVTTWTWSLNGTSGAAGLNTLGGIDFYAYAPAGVDCEYYVDDVVVERLKANVETFNYIENGMPGALVAESASGPWTTWSENPGSAEDAIISNDMAAGGLNSVYLSEASTDLVYHFGNITEGRYKLTFDIYVEAGAGAYYNLMHDFDNATYQWALEVVFNGDGSGNQSGGNTDAPFEYMEDAWNQVTYIIDLDNDNAWFYINHNFVQEWQWSLNDANGSVGLNQLAVMDIYPAGSTNPSYYIDNISLQAQTMVPSGCAELEDFSSYYIDEQIALNNPFWTTWSDDPGSSEDPMVSDEFYFSAPNSLKLEGGMGTDLVRDFGNLSSGSYSGNFKIYVPTGGSSYFNLLHVFDGPSSEWAMQVYFNNDGNLSLDAGGAGIATAAYTFDEWHDVFVYVDIDNNYAALYFDDEMVHEWPWDNTALGTGGSSTLQAMNFYPPSASALAYIDDALFCEEESGLNVEENSSQELSIYPNPANNVVYIMNNINEEVNLHMFNVAGQEVMNIQRVVNSGLIEISTADLNEGIYLIQLENANQVITKRIVVQH